MSTDRYGRYVLSFELSLRAKNRSPNTIYSYLHCLKQAETFLAGRGRTLHDARRVDLEAHLAELLTSRKPSTVATHYKALRVFYTWVLEEGELDASPMMNIDPPKVPLHPVPVLGDDLLRQLLATCSGTGFEDRRDTALIRLLVDAGPRRAEVMGIQLHELDLRYGLVRVHGKGGRDRDLPSVARPLNPSTATYAPGAGTRTPSCHGSGSVARASSPAGAWPRCCAGAASSSASPTSMRISSDTPSLTAGARTAARAPT